MTAMAFDPKTLASTWNAFQRALPVRLAAIHTQAEYDSAVEFMNQLLDVVGDDEEHELADMLELLGQLVEDFENAHHSLPDAEPGQVVSAGSPVVRIAQDGPRDVVFVVPEDKRGAIRVGQKVNVRPWSAGMQPLQGQVREVAASADPVTRTYQVKVALPASDAAAVPPLGATVHALPEGMGPTGQPVIKLPTTALRQEGGGGQGTAVWVFDAASSTVKLQPVQLATADGNEAVIAAGLTPGMQVVAAGVHVLTPGQKVTVYQDRYDKTQQPAQAPAAAGAAASAGAASSGAAQ